ncbi:MAG: hypothetical protein QOG71_1629 [Pyrinomonadaceae bacterium]|nr:hypothetical protein [Pyrinomonadaceae bacterium]
MIPCRKRFCLFFSLLLLVSVSACSRVGSYEHEPAIEKSLDEFHARMNEEQYQAIYADADPELRSRISEQDFTKRLAEAKERAGKIEGKASVALSSGMGRKLRKLFSNRENVTHFEITKCDAGSVHERFEWSLVNGTARLRDYELRQVLERGKIYKLGNSNIAIAPK